MEADDIPEPDDDPELTVYHRHVTQLLTCADRTAFEALLIQIRHITTRSYETSLYDHQQTFRLLWHHLDHVGHLRHAHRDVVLRLASGRTGAEETAELELFLALHARIGSAGQVVLGK
ncbi:hypothetical protein [Streptomyces sp. NBC_00102]|uniref:hypothetical protein n=1 Tax=Streptomyces sp. NBC_00102 TaxID=2975652 RepID=UPI002256CC0E|nr:hypothetical protein [Streptomyces sp. NBC_00102]MCX5400818.1 hypothetical protein [Streptomyces sp. NBC_00102]